MRGGLALAVACSLVVMTTAVEVTMLDETGAMAQELAQVQGDLQKVAI